MIGQGEMLQTNELQQPSVPENFRHLAGLGGYRSQLVVPLLSEGKPIGAIAVTRAASGKFPDHHIQLLQTFADQAVIAIENVRLFEEVQAKTRELSEALTYQTGSGNILKVIASSPTNVGPLTSTVALRNASPVPRSGHRSKCPETMRICRRRRVAPDARRAAGRARRGAMTL